MKFTDPRLFEHLTCERCNRYAWIGSMEPAWRGDVAHHPSCPSIIKLPGAPRVEAPVVATLPNVDEADERFRTFRTAVEGSAQLPSVRELARRLTQPAPFDLSAGARSSLQIKHAQAAQLLAAVQARVAYCEQPDFIAPVETWLAGRGDCKASSALIGALALSVGCYVRLLAMGWNGDPCHVVCQLRLGPFQPWLFAETTIPGAALGEHPSLALMRLGSGANRRDLEP